VGGAEGPLDRSARETAGDPDRGSSYADFEGVIPEGEYGAGTVVVWDRGSYRSLGEEPIQALEQGHATVWLEARGFAAGTRSPGLARERASVGWLVKMDEGADRRRNPVSSQPKSALSGKTIDEFAKKQ
jgi:ATP-dependent DNA ligase